MTEYVPLPSPADDAPRLVWALWQAHMGYHLFPVHAPLFGHETGYTCTCEFWRHTEDCQAKRPDLYLDAHQHCENAGKCPAVKWRDKSTTDPALLKRWFGQPRHFKDDRTGQWYAADMNIGIDCGKSDLLVLDADTYKDTYLGDSLLSQRDEETVIVITGSGGEHLYYRRPDGKDWGNATDGLPAGIDIRGVGGYVVAPGSRHRSGALYLPETGYGPQDMPLQPVPGWLAAILDHAPGHRRSTGQDSGPSDLAAVNEAAARVQELLHQAGLSHGGMQAWNGAGRRWSLADCPYSADHRDGAFIVICQDGTIGAGCHHNRCQKRIEEAGSGWRLLKEITGFQPAGDAHRIEALRLWIRTSSFADLVPQERQAHYWARVPGSRGGEFAVDDAGHRILDKIVYRTDSTDTKVADAILDIAEKAHRLTGLRISLETIRAACNLGSRDTARNALARLAGWFVEPTVQDDGSVTYSVLSCLDRTVPTQGGDRGVRSRHDKLANEYTPHKGDDVFALGRSRLAKRLGLELKSLGEGTLRVIDALGRAGPQTRRELRENTGKSAGALGAVTRRGEELGLFAVEQEAPRKPKVYSLAPDIWQRVREMWPKMRTYLVSAERLERQAAGTLRYCDARLARGGLEPAAQWGLERQRARAISRRAILLGQIYPDWTEEEALAAAMVPPADTLRAQLVRAKLHRFHAEARAEIRQADQANLTMAINDLRGQNVPRGDWLYYLELAGYAAGAVKAAMARGGGMSG